MNPKSNKINEQMNLSGLEAELEKLEDMWDRIIEKGDDDQCETAQFHRQRQSKAEQQPEKRIRRRGRRM